MRWSWNVVTAVMVAALVSVSACPAYGQGSIAAWGWNNYGQCNVPAPNNGFVAVAGGAFHSLGLKADGAIVAWGTNNYGQCNVPAPNSGFVAVAGGGEHSLGLKVDGSIVAWGRNGDGQCNVPGPNSGFVAVAGGAYHSLGLKSDGSIVAWGWNYYGQCNVPAPNSGFVAITAGGYHSLGLKADGSIVAWGNNSYGQCNVPSPNTGFVAVSGGWTHNLGLKADGSIVAWGYNNYGQCDVPSPNTDFTAVTAGAYHSLGLKADGSIMAWGSNSHGQCNVPVPNSGFTAVTGGYTHTLALGTGSPGAAWGCGSPYDYGQCDVPAPNIGFAVVGGGGYHSLGLKCDGSIVAWGWNGYGQCNVPAPNSDFIAVVGGDAHSLGLKADGSIVAWGDNYWGQCNVPAPNNSFIAVAGGGGHSLGLKANGSIVAWGDNYYGQCNVPAPNTGFLAVAGGGWHSLGLKAAGSIVAWGRNDFGQCNVSAPNTSFVAVTGSSYHSLGLKVDGSITAWGWNGYGQCNVPAPNSGFTAVAGGGWHSLGLKAGGSIVAWGLNDAGQCNVPAPNSGFTAVSGGVYHGLGLKGAPSVLDVPGEYPTIQAAIDAAVPGDQVVVADGVYTGTGNKDLDFGGKAITVRSASGDPALCIIDCQDSGQGFYFHGGETAATVVEGFTIRNGSVTGGGSMRCSFSSPMLINCTISGNTAFTGGGVYCYYSSPTLTNCTISGNTADEIGGGVYCYYSSPTLTNCTISGNTGGWYAGGVDCESSSTPMLTNCTISGNKGGWTGGGMLCLDSSSPTLTNCTLSGNTALYAGGVYRDYFSSPTLTNCILWANTPPQITLTGASTPVLTYCDVQGGYTGMGNIDADPHLTTDGHLQAGSACIDVGDNTAVPPGITTDRDGEPRFVGTPSNVDIGADEFVDTDADSLPNWWESKYFTPPDADPYADSDGDGLTNSQEYEGYGSNPVALPYYVDAALGDDAFDGRSPTPIPPDQGPKQTIQAALSLASSGDTVLVAAGMYTGAGNFSLNFADKAVVVRAPSGPGLTTIDCGAAGSVVYVTSTLGGPVILEGFTIRGGAAAIGAGLNVRFGRLMLRDCVFADNVATVEGGGIYSGAATLTVDDLTIMPNVAPQGDGGVIERNNVDLLGPLYLAAGTLQAYSTWFDGPGHIDLAGPATLQVTGAAAGDPATVIRSNVTGTGTIVIDAGQQLLIVHGAIVDLSGETGSGCADPEQSANWGTIEVNGQLVVRDATVRNTNVDVLAGDLSDATTIYNNEINLLQNPPGWGGEFFVEGTSTIECNVIHSEGDRYLDLDPDPSASPRPTIDQNKFYVNILQGTATPQGELLELRTEDIDNVVGGGMSGAYQLGASAGYNDIWALEQLEVQPNAKVNLTNRQGFVFQDPEITIPEAIYVKQVKLHPDAVLNTGMQRLYYQSLVDQNNQTLTRDPNDPFAQMSNGSRIVDVPLLGFSLKVIAMEDETEFGVRVQTRVIDLDDPNPPLPTLPTYQGKIERLTAPDNPANSAMKVLTHDPAKPYSATSVSAHGAFARAGEDEIIVAFDYLFCGTENDELIVYLADSPEVGNKAADDPAHYVEVARVYPPLSGRAGSVGSSQFATFFGSFPREGLNFTRGTYVELELRGADACVWIDDWDPQVKCLTPTCGDFNGDYAATGVDFLYVLGEYGLTLSATHPKWCLDRTNGDHYVDVGDVYAWDTRLHDPTLLNLCGSGSKSGGGDKDGPRGTPVTLPAGALIIAGKQGGQESGIGQQDDFLYAKDPTQVSVQVNGSTATTIIDPNICLADPVSPASDPNAQGHYRGNGRMIRDKDGAAYQLHGSEGLIRLTDAAHVMPYGQVTFGSSTAKVGVNPANGNGVPIADAAFSPTSTTVVYVAPVLVTAPGYAAYKAAAKLNLLPSGNPPYTVQQIYGLNPRTDTRVTVRTVGGQPVFEPDFQRLREVEIDAWGNLFVLSAQADNDNDWVLAYNEATGNSSERCILLSGGAPACCASAGSTLQGPTAMALSADGGTMYLASSVNGQGATSTSVYRFTINRGGSQEVTGLTPAGVVQVQGMREVSALLEKPSSSDLWVLGTMSPTFDEYTTFNTNCAANPNCEVPMWPLLAVIPPNVTTAVAANMTCHDLALPISALFTGQACGTGDFDGGGLGMSDVQPFIAALLDPAPSPATICTGDLNHDIALDGRDIQLFVTALLEE